MKKAEKNWNSHTIKDGVNTKRVVALALATTMAISAVGCSSSVENSNSASAAQTNESSRSSELKTENLEISSVEKQKNSDKTAEEEPEFEIVDEGDGEDEETDQQKNAINMLNYITTLTQKVNDSKESRLFLEQAYSSLINNTYPNAVDSSTETRMLGLLETMEEYRMISVKRERLEYIYEQNKAQAMKSAIPSPVALLSVVQSGSLLKAAASVVYMAVDSASSYQSASAQADLTYLQDGWELDDEEAKNLHESNKALLSYMLGMVRNYSLEGDYALNEDSVENFVKWQNKTNLTSKIQWLEDNQKTYEKFGSYWLELAKDYYDNGEYEKCLKSIEEYDAVSTKIFRKDYDYATTMPMAIIAAKETMNQDDYVEAAEKYTEIIVNNTDDDDWATRYFAAQIYLDLYKITSDKQYLQDAYDICLNSVNVLVDNQRTLNKEYLADVKKEDIPDGSTKQEKKEIKNYNKYLKEQRKKALPPVDESLYLNCELLFALADQLNISEEEQQKIDDILHENGDSLFLTSTLEEQFWFGDSGKENVDIDDLEIKLDADSITIPTACVSDQSIITVKINDKTIDDWSVSKVKRPKDVEASEFIATYKSEKAKKYKYHSGDKVTIQIAEANESSNIETVTYTAVETKKAFVLPDIKFERDEK